MQESKSFMATYIMPLGVSSPRLAYSLSVTKQRVDTVAVTAIAGIEKMMFMTGLRSMRRTIAGTKLATTAVAK